MCRSKLFRQFFVLNVALVMLLLTAACAPAAAPGGEAGADGEAVTIRFVTNHGDVEVPVFEEVVANFEAEFPNVKVDYLNATAQFEDTIKTQGVGGSLPDVWYARTFLTSDYATKGWTLNLAPLIDRDDVDVDRFWAAQIAQMSYEGDLYALPYDFSNVGIYFNKDIFDEMGVPYPTSDWTMEEMAEIAEQFVEKDADGKITRWGLNTIFPWSWPVAWHSASQWWCYL